MQSQDLVNTIQNLLEEKKAEDIIVLNLLKQNAIVDYMIIASGTSSRHVSTLADYTAYELKTQGIKTTAEGLTNCDWALIDAGDVLVHIFKPEAREFYNLEKMWGLPFNESTV